MCSVSAVSSYYTETYPNRMNPNPFQGLGPPAIPMPGIGGYQPPQTVVHQFDAETKDMLRQALKLLDKIDKKLGDVECMDEAKAAFLKSLDLDATNIGG